MKYSIVPDIDWSELQSTIETNEDDPSDIIHELVHAYECIGRRAFEKPIGRQLAVSRMIKDKYGENCRNTRTGNRHEVRVSAISFLVLQPFGQADFARIVHECWANMNRDFHQYDTVVQGIVKYLDQASAQKAADNVRNFCLKFKRAGSNESP